ncbi:MAG: T9SS type A sorting domain-containing protein, partial [Bacteroidales bacterium]|nr:T9SS type A sorting domain-containing protein [Bacteroidales bacterium]
LQANETKDYAFTMNYKVPNYTGTYTLVAYIEAYANDADNSNDTLSASFACTKDSTGIGNANAIDWTMGQNIPNPASSVTRIPYTLPQDGSVTFSVMNMNGQLLLRQEVRAEAGQNSIELNTGDWANGVYYYSMEYQGQRIVRKMSVNR